MDVLHGGCIIMQVVRRGGEQAVADEVEDLGAAPQRLNVWGDGGLGGSPRGGGGVSRARRRTPWAESLVKASPVYYGWVVAGLVTLCALVVSPAQVYSLGVVADAMIADLGLTRLGLSGIYATAALLSAPLITLHPLLLTRFSRRLLVSLTGSGVCLGLLLLSSSAGHVSLLLSFTLLQSVGPGMLYPCAEAVLSTVAAPTSARTDARPRGIGRRGNGAAAGDPLGVRRVRGRRACGCWRGAYSARRRPRRAAAARRSSREAPQITISRSTASGREGSRGSTCGQEAAWRRAKEEDGEEEEEDEETRQCTGAQRRRGLVVSWRRSVRRRRVDRHRVDAAGAAGAGAGAAAAAGADAPAQRKARGKRRAGG